MDVTKVFTSERFDQGLESWGWIGLEGKTPVLATAFGDVILQSEEGFWWLDTLDGSLVLAWANATEVQNELSSRDGQEQYLMIGLIQEAVSRGLVPGDDEVYDFPQPPILGGDLTIDNLTTTDFVVALNVAGQIHDQVKDLPPGTRIDSIKLT
jgi:hypothetical protein